VKTYSPKKVIVTLGGHVFSGYADGTFITVESASDAFTMQVGADGEPARSQSADESGSVKIVIMQTSASNDFLSDSLAKDRLTGLNVMPLFVKDASGRTLVSAQEAWVKKSANAEFAKEGGSREWTIESGKLSLYVGGN
jgi:hypothetical protein